MPVVQFSIPESDYVEGSGAAKTWGVSLNRLTKGLFLLWLRMEDGRDTIAAAIRELEADSPVPKIKVPRLFEGSD